MSLTVGHCTVNDKLPTQNHADTLWPTTSAPAATRPRCTMPRAGCLAAAFVPYDTQYPQAGWHEQRPEDWWDSVVQSTRQLLASRAADPAQHRLPGDFRAQPGLRAAGRRRPAAAAGDADLVRQAARGPGRPFFQRVDPARWYRLTGNGFPGAALHGLQDPLVSRPRAGNVPRDPQGGRHQGLHQLPADRPHRHGLLVCVGKRRLRSAGLGLLRRAAGRGRPAARLAAGDRAVDRDLGALTAEAAEALGLPRRDAGGLRRGGQFVHGLRAQNIARGEGLRLAGLVDVDRRVVGRPLLDDAAKPYVFTHVVPGMFTSAVAIFSGGTSLRWVRDQLCRDLVGPGRGRGDRSLRADDGLGRAIARRGQASCCSIPAWPAARRWTPARTSAAPSRAWTWATRRPTWSGRRWKASP